MASIPIFLVKLAELALQAALAKYAPGIPGWLIILLGFPGVCWWLWGRRDVLHFRAKIKAYLRPQFPRSGVTAARTSQTERNQSCVLSYIDLVAVGENGQLVKHAVPMNYLYALIACSGIGLLSLTALASQYTRNLIMEHRMNQVRVERVQMMRPPKQKDQTIKDRDTEVASLTALAGEVASLYGLQAEKGVSASFGLSAELDQAVSSFDSIDEIYAPRAPRSSSTGLVGIPKLAPQNDLSTAAWMRASAIPNLWPVEGRVTRWFGEGIDPVNGEGAFHKGVDISAEVGDPVIAPADGEVGYADFMRDYGRTVLIAHTSDVSTRYGHLSAFVVIAGQTVHRGDVIGYVGFLRRGIGPGLHYEVRIGDRPVNPLKYLRMKWARHRGSFVAGT